MVILSPEIELDDMEIAIPSTISDANINRNKPFNILACMDRVINCGKILVMLMSIFVVIAIMLYVIIYYW